MTALAVLAISVFCLLGRWQWQRATQKAAQLAAFAAASALPATELGGRVLDAVPRFTQIEVGGRFDGQHQFLLDNMTRDGQAGYEILTPMQLTDGRWLLVNRGWLPLRDGARERMPDIDLPASSKAAADTKLRGRVDELPAAGIASGRAPPPLNGEWPKLASFPSTAELAAALGQSVEPRQLLLAAGESDGYRRDWQPPNAGFTPARHLSYAIQWWSLAALVALLYGFFKLRRWND
jgi:surfeit locus 1 family protein